jgi:hypothetical protein
MEGFNFDFSAIDPTKLYELSSQFNPSGILQQLSQQSGMGLQTASLGAGAGLNPVGGQSVGFQAPAQPPVQAIPTGMGPPPGTPAGQWDWLAQGPKSPSAMPTPPGAAPLTPEHLKTLAGMMPKPQNPNDAKLMPAPGLPGRPGQIQMNSAQLSAGGGYNPMSLAAILNGGGGRR